MTVHNINNLKIKTSKQKSIFYTYNQLLRV